MNKPLDLHLLALVLASLAAALVISFAATPLVKRFAQKVGAMDVPKDGRRMHDHTRSAVKRHQGDDRLC